MGLRTWGACSGYKKVESFSKSDLAKLSPAGY